MCFVLCCVTGTRIAGSSYQFLPRRRGGFVLQVGPQTPIHCTLTLPATPGCTNEAHAFRDLYRKFRKLDCEVIGVSRDSVASHAKFRAKHDLPFPLVADIDEAWCKAFDVLGEKTLYGRRFVGVIRSTFLIDASGTLVAEWRGVRVPGHAAAVLERLSAR